MLNNETKIICRATVIEPQLAIHFFTAATVVPGENIKAVGEPSLSHSLYIRSMRVSLQTMGNDQQLFRSITNPIEIEKIVIGCNDAFARVGSQLYLSEHAWKYGFHMRIEEEERCLIGHWCDGRMIIYPR